MRTRSVSLIFAAVLLLAAAVAAADTPPSGETSPAAAVSTTPLAAALNGCSANLSSPLELPGLNPAGTPRITSTCGTDCSENPCKGATYNSTCIISGIHGFVGKCLSPLGNTCSGPPLTWQCQCWTGPLP